MSKQSRSSRLTKQRSRSQSPEDMARSDNGCGDDDDDNIDVDDGDNGDDSDDVRIRSSIHGRHLQQQFVSDYRTIVSRRPYTPEITPSRCVLFIVELSRTQDGFRSTQMMNIADFRWTHHANTPMPATPTSMQRFLSPPPLKSCNKLTLVNRQTNNV